MKYETDEERKKFIEDFKVLCDQMINIEPINQEDLRVDIYFDPVKCTFTHDETRSNNEIIKGKFKP